MIINFIDILYKKNKKLEEQVEALNDKISQLSEENEELAEENENLAEMYNCLLKKFSKKINDYNRLECENRKLIDTIENQKAIFKKFLNGDLE